MTIYLCGHGNHYIKKHGFFTLPRYTTVTFYTLPGKTLHQKDAQNIVSDQPWLKPVRIAEGLTTCPNMTLSCDTPSDRKATEMAFANNKRPGAKLFFANDFEPPKVVKTPKPGEDIEEEDEEEFGMTLEDIIKLAPGHDYVWSCCYHIPLRKTPLGAKYGMNVNQYLEGGQLHTEKTRRFGAIGQFDINHGDVAVYVRQYLKKTASEMKMDAVKNYLNRLENIPDFTELKESGWKLTRVPPKGG